MPLRKNKYQIKDLKKVDFRHKPFIDNQHTILDLCFPDRTFMLPADSFPYYRGFVNQLVFRESCYECRYNCINRCSDLTIGDILGHSDILGANVIFCNTIMGEKIIEDLRVQNIIIKMEDNEIQINANRFLPKKKPNYYHLMKKIKYYPLLERFYLSNRKPIISRVIVRIKRRIRFLLSK